MKDLFAFITSFFFGSLFTFTILLTAHNGINNIFASVTKNGFEVVSVGSEPTNF
jgi:hypothetical protein